MSNLNVLAWQFHIAFTEITRTEESIHARIDLSKRERDCLRWTAEGKSSWDIGMILKISENTVNFHVKNILGKLHLANRTQAALWAQRHGL